MNALASAGMTPQDFEYTSGYSNTTTTINAGVLVARDIAVTTNGRAFVPAATANSGALLGILMDTVPPGNATAACDAYTDRILRRGIAMALVQGTTGGIAPGDKLQPHTSGGTLVFSAAAAAGASQANFTFAANIETTTVSGNRAVVVNL